MLTERGVDGAVVRVDLDRIRLAVHRLSEDADDIHLIFRPDDPATDDPATDGGGADDPATDDRAADGGGGDGPGTDGGGTGADRAFSAAAEHAGDMSEARVGRGEDAEQVGSQDGAATPDGHTVWFDDPSHDELNQRWLRDLATHLAEAGYSGVVDVYLEPDADLIVVPSGDAGLVSFWLGWRYDRTADPDFELHWPWWREDDGSFAAAVRARDESAAKDLILGVHDQRPADLHWLFAERRDDDWFPYTGRHYKTDWMPRWPETPAVYR